MDLRNKDRMRVKLAAAFITTEGEGEGGAAAGAEGEGAGSGEGAGEEGAGADDLGKLFSPEEVAAKKEALEASQVEEARRAALTDEERQAEDALKAEEAAKSQVPEKYADFTAPEGMDLDPVMVGKLSELAKEYGLTQDKAQALVNLGGELVQQVHTQMQEAWDTKRAGWLEQAQSDKEIGEDVKKGADSAAARAFSTIATPEMKGLMEELGIGDHPEVLRMFYRLSQKMKEDTFESGGSGSGLGEKGKEKAMYPSMEK